ncbi:MAG: hypothetical protein U0996_02910 [Planctomycetaceae bacterium]
MMAVTTKLPEPLLQRIVRTIHGESELNGCMIGYSSFGVQKIIHPGVIPTRNMLEKFVIIDFAPAPQGKVRLNTLPSSPTSTQSLPGYQSNLSHVLPEIIGLGCSLMCFTFSAAAFSAGTVSTPASGPGGIAVAVASWTGLVTSGIQAYNGIGRFWQIAVDPYGHQLEETWDRPDEAQNPNYYAWTILCVDAAGVGAGVFSMAKAAPKLWQIIQTRTVLKNITPEKLNGMEKAAKEKLLKTAYAELMATPGGEEEFKAIVRKMNLKGFSVAGAGKERHAHKVTGVLSKFAQQRLQASITDQVINAIGPGFSGLPASVVGSASGSVNKWVTDPGAHWLANAISVHVLHREN